MAVIWWETVTKLIRCQNDSSLCCFSNTELIRVPMCFLYFSGMRLIRTRVASTQTLLTVVIKATGEDEETDAAALFEITRTTTPHFLVT